MNIFDITILAEKPMTNLEAANFEHEILNRFKHLKIKIPNDMKFEGYTECLSMEFLNECSIDKI